MAVQAEKRETSVSVFDTIALATFGNVAEKVARAFNLYSSIRQAGLLIHPRLYAARLLFRIMLATVFSVAALFASVVFGAPLLVKVIVVLVALIAPAMIFAWGLYYPAAKASERAAKTDNEFPFFAAYVTAMAYGGVSPERLIERLTTIKVFKALREEAERIMREVKLFGVNILTALEKNAVWHPSRLYRDFMLGYLTTLRTGGDVIHYLEIRTAEVFQARMEDLRNRAERVGLIVEAYATVAVLGTMAFYIFFIVSGLIATGGGMGGTTGLILYNFVALPLVSIAIVMILDSLLPSTETIREPYAYLLVSGPLGVTVAMAVLSLLGGFAYEGGVDVARVQRIAIAAALALIITGLGPGVKYLQTIRKERAIARMLAAFLRDLSEVRRTGLSPEKSIIMLSERDYGPLSPIIKRIAGALSLGLHVEIAVRRAISGYRNWLLRVTMRFLVDAMEVGGGSPHTIDSLARFMSTLVEINEQMRKRLRPYIVMPYFGSIMVAVTAILTLAMLVNAISTTAGGLGASTTTMGAFGGLQVSITPESVHQLLLMATLASLVNAWLSGIVAGKIQDQTVAAGLLHAAILTAITLITILVVMTAAGSMLSLG